MTGRIAVTSTILAVGLVLQAPLSVVAANRRPAAVSVVPAPGEANPQRFTAVFADADGWRTLRQVILRIRPAGAAAPMLEARYRVDTGRVSLFDRGSWQGALRVGAPASFAGEAGRLYARHCRVRGSGTRLTVTWFLGVRAILEDRDLVLELRAQDAAGAWSPWKSGGTWRAPSPHVLPFPVLPADNPWNTDVSGYPVHPNSDAFIASVGADRGLHPDFGTAWEGSPIGIPFVRVPADQPLVPISFYYPDESDPGPYPIPAGAPIEGGPLGAGDRHILVLDPGRRLLYEVFDAHPVAGGWTAGSGAVFDLTSNALRPDGWTSADAAGLPIFAGLVRFEEVQAGVIPHALRFTVSRTQRGYIHPATHFASSSTDPNLPPMGLRVRLKAGFDTSGFTPAVRTILEALKTYGMFVADNGSDWYLSGAPNENWDDDELHALGQVRGRDFEAVWTGPILP